MSVDADQTSAEPQTADNAAINKSDSNPHFAMSRFHALIRDLDLTIASPVGKSPKS
jgi:hypothetical protein